MESSVVISTLNNDNYNSNTQGLAALMPMAYRGEDLSELTQHLIDRAAVDDADALYDLSIILQLVGDKSAGLQFQNMALQERREYRFTPAEKSSPIRLLAFVAPGDLMTNTPLEFIAAGAKFELILYYIDTATPLPRAVPEHDVAIVALSELDRNRPSLALLETWLPAWPRPVLNKPENVRRLSRDTITEQLAGYNCLCAPKTIRASSEFLQEFASADMTRNGDLSKEVQLPFVIRPIDSHAGQGLARIRSREELDNYLELQQGPSYFVCNFVDYRNDDGSYRKYRIVLIDGVPKLVHMAISSHWMIHYLNAGMGESAAKRFEEAQAMGNFEQGFARRHKHAFSILNRIVGLDYFGIDCAETKDGRLLIFEVGASLNVHAMDCDKTFPYKKPQVKGIFDTFHSMLKNRKVVSQADESEAMLI